MLIALSLAQNHACDILIRTPSVCKWRRNNLRAALGLGLIDSQ